jgi:hypothetical protein
MNVQNFKLESFGRGQPKLFVDHDDVVDFEVLFCCITWAFGISVYLFSSGRFFGRTVGILYCLVLFTVHSAA